MKIAAAYIRVSSDDQLEYSPDSQLKLIREAAKRDGYFVPDELIFSDDGISGRSVEKRPAFRLMIAQAKQEPAPFEAVYVWKYSRFARNQEEAILYKNLLRKRGIAVVSISEPSSDSPYASLIERVIEWMDEFYLINLAGEVRRGMKEKATRGEAMGTAPFGYRVKDKAFVVQPDEAEIVRYVFSRFAAGVGARTLARELSDKGVRTRRGNAIDNRWVIYVVSNPVYTGKIRWSTEGHANYSRENYSGENVLLVDGKHEAIISPVLWDAAQSRLAERESEPKYVRKAAPRLYMLKGLLRCSDCGSTLVMQALKTPTLQCCSYARGTCGVSHSISVAKAEAAVIEGLREVIGSGNYVFKPARPKAEKLRRDWSRLISGEELKLSRAREGYLSGVFTADEYKKIKAELELDIERLRAAQAEDDAEAAAVKPDAGAMAEKARSVLQLLESPDLSAEAKNAALRSIVDKIVFRKEPRGFDFYFR